MSFGETLKAARKARGMTQRELADIIGTKNNSVCDWEKGKCKPDVDTIELICGALDISPSALLGIDNNASVNISAEQGVVEAKIIKKYNSLDEGHKQVVLKLLDSLVDYELKYKVNK